MSGCRVFSFRKLLLCTTAPLALASAFVVITPAAADAQTLSQALADAYTTSPKLLAERARLRATDEEVAKALAGYRPTVRAIADTGYDSNRYEPSTSYTGKVHPRGYRLQVSQAIFDPKTAAAVSSAEARVIATRELLRATETQVLIDAVTAYNNLIRDNASAKLQRSYVDVLSQELVSAQRQQVIGEKTLTDVAQAQNRLAADRSQLDVAIINQRSSVANYRKVIGTDPGTLQQPPLPTELLPRTLDEALAIAMHENPAIVSAIYQEKAARSDIDAVRSEFMPTLSVDAQARSRSDESTVVTDHSETVLTGTLVVPIYAGGDEHARLRASKQTQFGKYQDIEQTRTEVESAVVAGWSRYQGALARSANDRVQISSAETALRGVQEEERSGLRTSLDVLNARQDLINAQVTAVATGAEIANSAFNLIGLIGRLDPESVSTAKRYDATAYYKAVRDKWIGDVPAEMVPVRAPAGTALPPAATHTAPAWQTSITTGATTAAEPQKRPAQPSAKTKSVAAKPAPAKATSPQAEPKPATPPQPMATAATRLPLVLPDADGTLVLRASKAP